MVIDSVCIIDRNTAISRTPKPQTHRSGKAFPVSRSLTNRRPLAKTGSCRRWLLRLPRADDCTPIGLLVYNKCAVAQLLVVHLYPSTDLAHPSFTVPVPIISSFPVTPLRSTVELYGLREKRA